MCQCNYRFYDNIKVCEKTKSVKGVGSIRNFLMAFMLFDITISCVACARQNERKHNIPPKNSFDVFLDNKYPDEFMDKIYNNRILIEK